jgi:hypothetical protein
MDIDITDSKVLTQSSVTINFTGNLDPIRWPYSDRYFQPDRLRADYVHQPGSEGLAWTCNRVRVSGSRVLKPGPDGSVRLGVERGDREWNVYHTGDILQPDRSGAKVKLPEWVAKLVDELRPNGEVTTI